MLFSRGEKQRKRRTLEERRLRNFFSNSITIRWMIGIGFVAGLILVGVVWRSFEVLDLSVNQIVPRTIYARVSFSTEDPELTRQEADRRASLAPKFYQLIPKAPEKSLLRVSHLFERIKKYKYEGVLSQSRAKELADIWNESSTVSLQPEDVARLVSVVSKKDLFENLQALVQKFARQGIVGDIDFSNPDTTIAYGADPNDFSQIRVAHAKDFLTVSQARQRIQEGLAAASRLTPAQVKSLDRVVGELVVPTLQFDLQASGKYQDHQRKLVKPMQRRFNVGDVLVERGTSLTESGLALLKEHERQAEKQVTRQAKTRERIGTSLMILVLVAASVLVLTHRPRGEPAPHNREYALMGTIVLFHFVLCRLVLNYANQSSGVSPTLVYALMPLSFGSILAGILLSRNQSNVIAFLSSFLVGVVTQFNFTIVLSALVSSLVGIHFVSPLRRRTRIYEAGIVAGLVSGVVMMVSGIMWEVDWGVIGQQSICAVLSVFIGCLLISAILPIFEWLFRVTTDLSWLELSDLNHPLLRRMIMEAPGTYHHSLVVANLAERACEAIGANSLQARVCSYFHDVGKMNKPEYFCENQVGMENPHNDIAPTMSALIIIAHVKDGVDMAIQHKLARPIIDTILQHHGTSQVTYFYRMAKRNEEEAKLGSKIIGMNENDVPRVEEDSYRYPGPKPQTREIAVISLADSVEGASRSMLKPTPQKVEALVNEIIEDRYADGQLDECPLTLREIKVVSESFTKTILSMMHTRVSYPKDEPNADQPASVHSTPSSRMA